MTDTPHDDRPPDSPGAAEEHDRPPWHDVPIHPGRDLASDELWKRSLRIAQLKRDAARNAPSLPKARKTSVSIVAAAVAAAAPALGSAHTRSSERATASRGADTRPALEKGDRGKAVARIQRALGIPDDGVFGPQTRKAVRAFQASAGLTVDGIVGPQTRAALGLGSASKGPAGVLELGDRGAAVKRVQQALGIHADGIFGPKTRKAVRAFQTRAGLTVDGIVGPQTQAALGRGIASAGDPGHTHASSDASTPDSVDRRLGPALALAREMGLDLISAHRPGATISASGNRSDHAYYPSKAIDLRGSKEQMRRYALAVAGVPGVEIVIYSGVGIWISGSWREIRSSSTYSDHLDHVHVDTF